MPVSDAEMRKKISLYLHPDELTDQRALASVENVSRKKRGELYRQALISGLALHQIDSRLPSLITALHSSPFSVDDFIRLLATVTGWKPKEADINEVIKHLNMQFKAQHTETSNESNSASNRELEKARGRLNSLI